MHCHLQKSEYVYRVFGKKYGLECTRGRAHILIPAYKGTRCSITAAFVDKKHVFLFLILVPSTLEEAKII